MTSTSYDEVPYLSYAIRQTHVGNLRLLGLLFGMQPPDCTSCRVLEIGGASGGNLIPMAATLPQSEFVCLDPSVRQIEEGRRHAAALSLRNLRFVAGGIEDLERKARFDYVLCHGVFSWVPLPVQEAVFRALQASLTPHGVAFVSYNTLPGRHAYHGLREILLRHCAQERRPQEKARLAREMLELLEKGAADPRSMWGPLLLAEIQRLRAASDGYLLHEYLDEYSEAFYFSDFMSRARQYGLQYLAECDVHTMYIANAPPSIPPAVLASDDIEALEQYIDFGLNRAFRQTLLCRASVALERTIARHAVDICHVQSSLMPDASDAAGAQGNRMFRASSGAAMATSDPVAAEVLATLARHASLPVSAETAITEVRARLPGRDPNEVRSIFRRVVLQAYFAGAMQLYSLAPLYVPSVSTRPRTSAVAREEAKYGPVVTNARHEAIVLTALERTLVAALDGETSLADLARQFGSEVPQALERLAAHALLCG